MSNIFPFLCFLLLVEGVSGNKRIKVTVTVIEGDSVTLKPDDGEIQKDETILWTFNGSIITSEAVLKRFGDRLNDQNGSLTIKNIRSTDSGLYKLNIDKSTEEIIREYSVTVSAVTVEMKTVSVREGEPIIVHTGLYEKQGYDLILWKFGDRPIANRLLPHDSSDERFKGRLRLYLHRGDLIIRDSKSTDSGVYHLDMNSSTYSVQRSISVTVSAPDKPTPGPGLSSAPDKPTPGPGLSSVPDKPAPVSGLSSGAVAGIFVGLLVLFAAVIAAVVNHYSRKITELKGPKDVEKNGTNVPLNAETANSDAS